MPETFQLRLIWLLTLRCEGMTEKMSSEELMYGLDCDETTLQKIHETFLQKGFIEKNWAVVNWDKRQYISDSSTPRVKKYRANKAMKQGETFQKQFHETHETQNETDQNRTEQNRTKKNTKSEFEEIYQAYPKHEGKLEALRAIGKAVRSNGHDASWYLGRVQEYARQTQGSDPRFIPLPATWFNKGNYLNENLEPKPKLIIRDASTGEVIQPRKASELFDR